MTGERLKVSVIIVNWNGRDHLECSLAALQKQTLTPTEIIVVDNGSADDSVEFVKRNHREVKLIELADNEGFTGGNIAGYEAAIGDYIVLLNNDTKPLPDWLEKLTSCAESQPDVGIVAAHLTDWTGELTDSAGDTCSKTGRGSKRNEGRASAESGTSCYVFTACAGAALYKREMLRQVGFLDPRFFMNAEDTDLAFRSQLQGWKVYFCADALVRHRVGASQGLTSDKTVFFNVRNHLLSYWKCMPFPLIVKHSLTFWLEAFKLWLIFRRRGQGRVYLSAFWAGVAAIPGVLADRRSIQASRRISIRALEEQLVMPRLFSSRARRFGRWSEADERP